MGLRGGGLSASVCHIALTDSGPQTSPAAGKVTPLSHPGCTGVGRQDWWAWGRERQDLGPSFGASYPRRAQVSFLLPEGIPSVSGRPKEGHQGPGHLVSSLDSLAGQGQDQVERVFVLASTGVKWGHFRY